MTTPCLHVPLDLFQACNEQEKSPALARGFLARRANLVAVVMTMMAMAMVPVMPAVFGIFTALGPLAATFGLFVGSSPFTPLATRCGLVLPARFCGGCRSSRRGCWAVRARSFGFGILRERRSAEQQRAHCNAKQKLLHGYFSLGCRHQMKRSCETMRSKEFCEYWFRLARGLADCPPSP